MFSNRSFIKRYISARGPSPITTIWVLSMWSMMFFLILSLTKWIICSWRPSVVSMRPCIVWLTALFSVLWSFIRWMIKTGRFHVLPVSATLLTHPRMSASVHWTPIWWIIMAGGSSITSFLFMCSLSMREIFHVHGPLLSSRWALSTYWPVLSMRMVASFIMLVRRVSSILQASCSPGWWWSLHGVNSSHQNH